MNEQKRVWRGRKHAPDEQESECNRGERASTWHHALFNFGRYEWLAFGVLFALWRIGPRNLSDPMDEYPNDGEHVKTQRDIPRSVANPRRSSNLWQFFQTIHLYTVYLPAGRVRGGKGRRALGKHSKSTVITQRSSVIPRGEGISWKTIQCNRLWWTIIRVPLTLSESKRTCTITKMISEITKIISFMLQRGDF